MSSWPHDLRENVNFDDLMESIPCVSEWTLFHCTNDDEKCFGIAERIIGERIKKSVILTIFNYLTRDA